MQAISEEQRDQFLTTFRREAVHLEMRDVYATTIERDRFRTWLRGEPMDPETEAEWWRHWFDLMKRNNEAGKTLRRLRIVSEPVTDYIRFEWLDAAQLVRAGEDVRWLPRRNASKLLLPGNDFWMFDDLPNDVDEAVAARMERQRVLYTGNRRFAFVLEEQTLRTRVGDTDVMLGQLDRLLAVMSLPRVSLGIIPSSGERHCLAQGSFWIFDEDRVKVEGVSAGLDITQPREIAVCVKAFALLHQSAVYGKAARGLIQRALTELEQT